jgi:hypothetical protein
MVQRLCHYCHRPFEPEKPYFYWCSYACRQADPQDSRGYQRSRDASYDLGYFDGFRSGYQQGLSEGQTQTSIPPDLWRQMISLTHPDRYADTPLVCAANTCVRWLLEHRPDDAEQN